MAEERSDKVLIPMLGTSAAVGSPCVIVHDIVTADSVYGRISAAPLEPGLPTKTGRVNRTTKGL